MFKRVFATALVFGMAAIAPPVLSMPLCLARGDMARLLEERHSETHQATGLQEGIQLLELWVSDATGSWSVLITHPDGRSCLVATGHAWTEAVSRPSGIPS